MHCTVETGLKHSQLIQNVCTNYLQEFPLAPGQAIRLSQNANALTKPGEDNHTVANPIHESVERAPRKRYKPELDGETSGLSERQKRQ